MAEPRDLVVEALTGARPDFEAWSVSEWALLTQQARAAGLLGRVGERLREIWPTEQVGPWPQPLEGHLAAAERLMRAQRDEVQRELGHITRALAGLGAPVILLKGAAYLAAGLPPGRSRLFSDVDILVPKAVLAEVESRLMLAGWMGGHQNAYDQRYYRQWMHELPPMTHVRRGTTLDVHHNILPETARLKPDAARLVATSMPLPAHPALRVLGPPEMVLHSATHLFMNEEMSHGLRDLSDLDLLLRHFARDPGFWATLLARAAEHDLERPLHYALVHAARVFATPVPPAVLEHSRRGGPGPVMRQPMHWLWCRALRNAHPRAALPGSAMAHFALYVRGHWLRMPPVLLACHLTVKALRLHERQPLAGDVAPTQG